MPGKGTIDAIFILRIQEYLAKQNKLYMCYVDLEKAFDRAPGKVEEWAIRKRAIPEALFREVMSQHKGAKKKMENIYLKNLR